MMEPSYPVSGWGYSDLAISAIKKHGGALLKANPTDAKEWCPTWDKVDRASFYNTLLSAMAKRESGWDTNQIYTESFADAHGVKVQSTGLLQVSIESCRSYGASAKTSADLKNPALNLECGVKILNRWIPKDLRLAGGKTKAWLGASHYWSVMRPGQSKDYVLGKVREFCRE